MIFSYKRFKTDYGDRFRPIINVEIFNGFRSIRTNALVDTGADTCIFNCGFAEHLGIDYEKGRKEQSVGIAKVPKDIYFFDLELEIVKFENSRIKIPIGFIKSQSVGGLLGQIGFMENFKLSFEKYNNKFEIDLKS